LSLAPRLKKKPIFNLLQNDALLLVSIAVVAPV